MESDLVHRTEGVHLTVLPYSWRISFISWRSFQTYPSEWCKVDNFARFSRLFPHYVSMISETIGFLLSFRPVHFLLKLLPTTISPLIHPNI
jgi:hypothetical protein